MVMADMMINAPTTNPCDHASKMRDSGLVGFTGPSTRFTRGLAGGAIMKREQWALGNAGSLAEALYTEGWWPQ